MLRRGGTAALGPRWRAGGGAVRNRWPVVGFKLGAEKLISQGWRVERDALYSAFPLGGYAWSSYPSDF